MWLCWIYVYNSELGWEVSMSLDFSKNYSLDSASSDFKYVGSTTEVPFLLVLIFKGPSVISVLVI